MSQRRANKSQQLNTPGGMVNVDRRNGEYIPLKWLGFSAEMVNAQHFLYTEYASKDVIQYTGGSQNDRLQGNP